VRNRQYFPLYYVLHVLKLPVLVVLPVLLLLQVVVLIFSYYY
jgi:hypothetical protein